MLTFTSQCTFTRGDDGLLAVAWNNGNALQAVTGAAIDYIPAHFHLACTVNQNEYNYQPGPDLNRLIAGGVPAKLAMIVVGMRKVALSMAGIQFNIAEVAVVQADAQSGSISEADWRILSDNQAAFNGVIDLALTVVGLNGLSLLNKGHHYNEEDTMWTRLTEATRLDELMTTLGITAWEGIVFHDALHPITIELKTRWVTTVESPLIGHVNGVLFTRIPGVPAGTAIIHATHAALSQLAQLKPAAYTHMEPIATVCDALLNAIMADPLNWCATFQRAATVTNLSRVKAMEPACAFVYGVASKVFDRRSTILRSAALKNVSLRHAAATTLGQTYGTSLAEEVVDVETIIAAIVNLVPAMDNDEEEEDN